ncbi:MAG: hypothetical protein CMB56_005430 [Methanobacteriota archaeon]|nr:MAG: hypothetical protein CMB56_005430 [Euryarchaeota archaeon]|tara:strand:+ start:17019 stop:17246 length:228 start_codon:yes stop_codon:yes gene_type:complete
MECNIDARGKAVRLIGGILSLIAGIIIGILYGMEIINSSFWYTSSLFLIFGGCFGIFEGKSGWCVARAIGIKTPL